MRATNKKSYKRSDFIYGFLIEGVTTKKRQCVLAKSSYNRYCRVDSSVKNWKETYFSAFTFDEELWDMIKKTGGKVAGFDGPCCSDFLWFDIDDKDDLENARQQARHLALTLKWLSVKEDEMVIYFSGMKGFHIGIRADSFLAQPSQNYNRMIKAMASKIVAKCKDVFQKDIKIDNAIYAKVQPLRSPNTQHAESKCFKIKITFDELISLQLEEMKKKASRNFEFDAYLESRPNPKLENLWKSVLADERVEQGLLDDESAETPDTPPSDDEEGTLTDDKPNERSSSQDDFDELKKSQKIGGNLAPPIERLRISELSLTEREKKKEREKRKLTTSKPKDINDETRNFILNSAEPGSQRLVKIYQAALNLIEVGCRIEAVYSILRRPAEETGKPLKDIRSQLMKGIKDGLKKYPRSEETE